MQQKLVQIFLEQEAGAFGNKKGKERKSQTQN